MLSSSRSLAVIVALLAASTFVWGQARSTRRESPLPFDSAMRARLMKIYDLSNPQVDLNGLLAPGVDKDGIPALTDPKRLRAAEAKFPPRNGRVAVVEIEGQAVAYPLAILNFHEIANDTVADVPVAVTYCPLCDSVAVFDRRFPADPRAQGDEPGGERLLEFGVSGFLLNSNVVMYERGTLGLWSQVAMKAITGPHAGQTLRTLPVRMMTFADFQRAYPEGEVLSAATGHRRPYDSNPYEGYFRSPGVFRGHDFGFGRDLPPKTLGLGIHSGDFAAFVTASAAARGPITVSTPRGDVVVRASEAGLSVDDLPPGAEVVQTFYHSWSAFFPDTRIIGAEPAPSAAP